MNTEKQIKELMERARHITDVTELQNICDKLEELGAYEHAAWVCKKAAKLAEGWTVAN